MTIISGGKTSVVAAIGYDASGTPLKDRTIIFFTTDQISGSISVMSIPDQSPETFS